MGFLEYLQLDQGFLFCFIFFFILVLPDYHRWDVFVLLDLFLFLAQTQTTWSRWGLPGTVALTKYSPPLVSNTISWRTTLRLSKIPFFVSILSLGLPPLIGLV